MVSISKLKQQVIKQSARFIGGCDVQQGQSIFNGGLSNG